MKMRKVRVNKKLEKTSFKPLINWNKLRMKIKKMKKEF